MEKDVIQTQFEEYLKNLQNQEQQALSSGNVAKWYYNNTLSRFVQWQATQNELMNAKIRSWNTNSFWWYNSYKIWKLPTQTVSWYNPTKQIQQPYTATTMNNFLKSQLDSINTPKI